MSYLHFQAKLLAMKETFASSTFVVTDLEMAQVLGDPEHLRYIAPFLGFERTVGEVARELESTLSTTYRRVTHYCDLGILEVTHTRKRKGKALKVYRTVADEFFILNRFTNGIEESNIRWQAHWERDFLRGFRHAFGNRLDDWGVRLYRKDGVFTTALAQAPHEEMNLLNDDMPALFNCSHDSLYLDFAQAKAFQRELDALFNKYVKQKGQQRYMLRVSFVPVPEDAEIIP